MELPTLRTFAARPREALMWIPRALDIARIRAALAVAGPRVVDVGAGTGLLAHLLAVPIDAVEPTPPPVRYHELLPATRGAYDAAIVSWMEAGQDYRTDVAKLAPTIVNAYDIEGGCGIKGDVSFARFGYVEAISWRTASFEDAAYAIDMKGALQRGAWPGNKVEIVTRAPSLAAALRSAVEAARAAQPLPWEAEMDRLRL